MKVEALLRQKSDFLPLPAPLPGTQHTLLHNAYVKTDTFRWELLTMQANFDQEAVEVINFGRPFPEQRKPSPRTRVNVKVTRICPVNCNTSGATNGDVFKTNKIKCNFMRVTCSLLALPIQFNEWFLCFTAYWQILSCNALLTKRNVHKAYNYCVLSRGVTDRSLFFFFLQGEMCAYRVSFLLNFLQSCYQ